jgi:hypothetical protein
LVAADEPRRKKAADTNTDADADADANFADDPDAQ